jgi:hypothetical protein
VNAARFWPGTIVLSCAAAVCAVAVGLAPTARGVLVFWFLLVCPGMALVPLLGVNNRWTELTLGVAASLALDTLVAEAMVLAKLWSPPAGLAILSAVSLAGVATQLRLPLGQYVQAARARAGEGLPETAPPAREAAATGNASNTEEQSIDTLTRDLEARLEQVVDAAGREKRSRGEGLVQLIGRAKELLSLQERELLELETDAQKAAAEVGQRQASVAGGSATDHPALIEKLNLRLRRLSAAAVRAADMQAPLAREREALHALRDDLAQMLFALEEGEAWLRAWEERLATREGETAATAASLAQRAGEQSASARDLEAGREELERRQARARQREADFARRVEESRSRERGLDEREKAQTRTAAELAEQDAELVRRIEEHRRSADNLAASAAEVKAAEERRAAEVARLQAERAELELLNAAIVQGQQALDGKQHELAAIEAAQADLAARLEARESEHAAAVASLAQRVREQSERERRLEVGFEDLERRQAWARQREAELAPRAEKSELRERRLAELEKAQTRAVAELAKREADLARRAEDHTRSVDSLGMKAADVSAAEERVAAEAARLEAQRAKLERLSAAIAEGQQALEGKQRELAAIESAQADRAAELEGRLLAIRRLEHYSGLLAGTGREVPVEVALESEEAGSAVEWNIDTLDQLVADNRGLFPERAAEWGAYLVYLRAYADWSGRLPREFDSLVRDVFELVLRHRPGRSSDGPGREQGGA